jgi:hypothetical protein
MPKNYDRSSPSSHEIHRYEAGDSKQIINNNNIVINDDNQQNNAGYGQGYYRGFTACGCVMLGLGIIMAVIGVALLISWLAVPCDSTSNHGFTCCDQNTCVSKFEGRYNSGFLFGFGLALAIIGGIFICSSNCLASARAY